MTNSSAVWINTMDPKTSVDSKSSIGSLLFTHARDGNREKVREILVQGMPLATDTVGTTALHCAVLGDSIETCEMLIHAGINVDAKTKVDRTPLHLAAYLGHARIVQLLFEKKCSVDPTDMLLMTPLHWAVEKRQKEIVEMLLDRGASPVAMSKFRKTPLSLAQESGDPELIALLTRARSDVQTKLVAPQPTKSNEDIQLDIIDYEDEEDDEGDDGSISVFELNDSLDEDEGEVEVIPSGDQESTNVTIEESGGGGCSQEGGAGNDSDGRIVAQDMDESHLHESINKLGNIRGLKQADATTLKILQNIGISMLPTEDPDATLISNALQSGRNIILSEAGKYILNKTKSNSPSVVPMLPKTAMTTTIRPRQYDRKAPPQQSSKNSHVPNSATATSLVKPSVSSIVNATLAGVKLIKPAAAPYKLKYSTNVAASSSPSNSSEPNSLVNRRSGRTRKRSGEELSLGSSKVVLKEIRRAQQPWIHKLGQAEGSSSPVQFNSIIAAQKVVPDLEIKLEEVAMMEEDGEEEELEQVPLNRIQKMEQQILSLSRENKLLRNKLELSYKLIDENRKRIERLEEADPEKKRSKQNVEFIG